MTLEELKQRPRPDLRRMARDLQISGWPELANDQLAEAIFKKNQQQNDAVEQIVDEAIEKGEVSVAAENKQEMTVTKEEKVTIVEEKLVDTSSIPQETNKETIKQSKKKKSSLNLKKDPNDPIPFRSFPRRHIFQLLVAGKTKPDLYRAVAEEFSGHGIKNIEKYVDFTLELIKYKYGFVVKKVNKVYTLILPKV